MELYAACLTTAPVILLTVSRGLAFGPVPVKARHRRWKWPKTQVATDLAAIILVVAGAIGSLIVLGGLVQPTVVWRILVLTATGLSVFLLLLHVGGEVLMLYVSDRDAAAPSSHPPIGEAVAGGHRA